MPYATYLDFDAAGSSQLDRLTGCIEELDAGISTPRRLGFGHHLTLAVYDELDVPLMVELMPKVAANISQTGIVLPALGTFPGEQSVLFAAPYVTRELMLIHERYHELTAVIGDGRSHYHPGSWFPHATLALNLSQRDLEAAIGAASCQWSPINSRIASLTLVQFSPVETIWHGSLAHAA